MPLHSQKRPPSSSVLESKANTERPNHAENFNDDGGVLTASIDKLNPQERYEFWKHAQFRSTKAENSKPLSGKELIKEVKRYAHLPKREIAKQCGYVIFKNNQNHPNLLGFYDAVLAAKGVNLDLDKKVDRALKNSNRVSVNKKGQIVISSTCVDRMGFTEGDEFEVKIGRKHIHLIQIDRK